MLPDDDTSSTPAGGPRVWLIGALVALIASALTAASAWLINLRGLTRADETLLNLSLNGWFILLLAIAHLARWHTSDRSVTRLALGLLCGTLWMIGSLGGLAVGFGVLELERPPILAGTALVCLSCGAVLASIWRAWLGQPFRWAWLCGLGLVLGQVAGAWVLQGLCGPECDETRAQSSLMAGAVAGLLWALLAGPGLAVAIALPSVRAQEAATLLVRRATPSREPHWRRWVVPLTVVIFAVALVLRQGLQTCGWLDRALGRSGCVLVVPGYGSIGTLALSPDSTLLVHDYRARDDLRTLHLRRVTDGAVLATLAFDEIPMQIRFSPDGRLLAAAGASGLVRVWAVEDGAERYTLPVLSASVAFSADGATLLTTEGQWRASDGAPLGPLAAEDAGLDGIAGTGFGRLRAWSPDRSLLAEIEDGPGEDDDWIVLSDKAGQLPARRLEAPGGGSLRDLAFSPDGQMLAVASRRWGQGPDDPHVLVWRVSDGALIRTIPLEESSDALAWSVDSRLLLVWESYRRGVMGFQLAPE